MLGVVVCWSSLVQLSVRRSIFGGHIYQDKPGQINYLSPLRFRTLVYQPMSLQKGELQSRILIHQLYMLAFKSIVYVLYNQYTGLIYQDKLGQINYLSPHLFRALVYQPMSIQTGKIHQINLMPLVANFAYTK